MQKLNSRLEMYVLGVNELEGAKHAAERELAVIKQRMQQDLERVRSRLTKELEDTRTYDCVAFWGVVKVGYSCLNVLTMC